VRYLLDTKACIIFLAGRSPTLAQHLLAHKVLLIASM
jgi:hypothetical protein